MKFKYFLVIVIWFAVATPKAAAADAFNVGLKAFNTRDYTVAMLRLKEAARESNELAQEMVAQLYMQGHAAPKDPYEALYWYSRAGKFADNNGPVRELGAQGFELPESDKLVLKLYLQQAKAGDISAAYRLGNVYGSARGTRQDFEMAYSWYMDAAKAGHAYAQFEVGRAYYNGQGVSKDIEQAVKWVKLSADNGVTLAKYHYADFLKTGAAGYEDQASAVEYYEKAAEDGYGLAQFELMQYLLPNAKSSEARIEVMKWIFLSTDHMEQSQAQQTRILFSQQISGLTLDEINTGLERAKTFVRKNG